MKLNFYVDYRTNWGESMYIVGSIPQLGDNNEENAVCMQYNSTERWELSIDLPSDILEFDYHYIIINESGNVVREWGNTHKYIGGKSLKSYIIYDKWQSRPYDGPYYSSAFTEGILYRQFKDNKPNTVTQNSLYLRISAPMVAPDEMLAISGSNEQLGNWDINNVLLMNDACYPEWNAKLDLKKIKTPFEYKFLIVKKDSLKVVAWENGSNRYCSIEQKPVGGVVSISGLRFNSPLAPWHGAGVAIPVFSLRSEDDMGVGDFYDLMKMVDWAVNTGQKFLQLLPINDTTMTHTWTDSYPYNANSTFALHPMYIRLSAIGEFDKELTAEYEANAKELNAISEVDYERVNTIKSKLLHILYDKYSKSTFSDSNFKKFLTENEYWLKPYAAFCILRDENKTPEFDKWGEYAEYNEAKINSFCKLNDAQIKYIYFVQYHLDLQMKKVRDYAHQRGVVLKGDIPIGISRTSVDAWVYPKLFNMDCQAGAPPDDFSVLGQNWGFPTYNWEEMSKDGFKWWKNRFTKMSEYFDAYRIDHILGFFRIWQIPMDAVHGLLGYFYPALPYSVDELRNNYDFWIDTDKHVNPYIMDYFLYDFFGEYTEEVKNLYLYNMGNGKYRLKDEVSTQRKVESLFKGKTDDKSKKISNALMGLIDDVLFIEDANQKGHYHPRISAQFTYIYRSLTDYERWCFDRLYNDFFYHRHNDYWYGKAMWKLPPILSATQMLACGEDLGMIPDCVSAVMHNLQILSLEIQRMPKDSSAEFGDTYHYPYMSVTATSTHDMAGIRAWWEENRDKTQHFYNNVLHEIGDAPYFAEPWICERILNLQLTSPSMLAILPLQDWLSIDGDVRRDNPLEEQINIPANPRHYWRYRMHLSLESLNEKDALNNHIKDMITASGR